MNTGKHIFAKQKYHFFCLYKNLTLKTVKSLKLKNYCIFLDRFNTCAKAYYN